MQRQKFDTIIPPMLRYWTRGTLLVLTASLSLGLAAPAIGQSSTKAERGAYVLVDTNHEEHETPNTTRLEVFNNTSATFRHTFYNPTYREVDQEFLCLHTWSPPPSVVRPNVEVATQLTLRTQVLRATGRALGITASTRLRVDSDRGGPIISNEQMGQPVSLNVRPPQALEVEESVRWSIDNTHKMLYVMISTQCTTQGTTKRTFVYEWQDNPQPTPLPPEEVSPPIPPEEPTSETSEGPVSPIDGTLRNGATYTPGIVGPSFYFDGIDDYVHVAHRESLRAVDALSIGVWVRFDEVPRTGSFNDGMAILEKANNYAMSWRADQPREAPGSLWFNLADTRGKYGYGAYLPMPTLEPGSCHYMVVTAARNPSDTECKTDFRFYVDGEERAFRRSCDSGARTATWETRSDGALHIGARSLPSYLPPASGSLPFDGLLDEVEIARRIWSPVEVAARYQDVRHNLGAACSCIQSNCAP